MSKRYYRMTPARRAALKRAQQASARKRRRRKTAAVTAISVAAVGGGAIGGYKVRKRRIARGVAEYQAWNAKVYQKWARNAMNKPIQRPAIENRKDVTRFGKTRIGGGVMVDKSGRQRGNRVGLAKQLPGQAPILVPDAKRGFKVDSLGKVVQVGRLRGLYDNSQRWGYDREKRHRKYINWDKPRREAKRGKK